MQNFINTTIQYCIIQTIARFSPTGDSGGDAKNEKFRDTRGRPGYPVENCSQQQIGSSPLVSGDADAQISW